MHINIKQYIAFNNILHLILNNILHINIKQYITFNILNQ